jgi:hypothetical protein
MFVFAGFAANVRGPFKVQKKISSRALVSLPAQTDATI